MIASFGVFITHDFTTITSIYKLFLCIFGKLWEENRVQIACNKTGCANFVQKKLARILCKLVQRFWAAVARGGPVARPGHRGRVKGASGDSSPPAVKGGG